MILRVIEQIDFTMNLYDSVQDKNISTNFNLKKN